MKKSIEKPIDDFIRDYVKSPDPFNQYSRRELDTKNDELADRMFVFDCPITRAEFYTDEYMGCQGCAAIDVKFYRGKETIFTACQKENATSLMLYLSDADGRRHGRFGCCADPRIVATHIFAARLEGLGHFGKIDLETRIKEINAVINPVFTREEAIEWLERNFFIGEKALSRRTVACHDCFKGWQEKKYPECEPQSGYPGWDIWYLERKLAYVPPQAREVYDKYYSAWKEAKRRQEQKEKEERRKEAKRKLEEEKRRLEEAKRKLEEEKQRLEAEKRKLEEEKRRLEAAKQKKAPSKHAPKAPPTLKEVKRNWNEIIKTYEQIEKKKKAK